MQETRFDSWIGKSHWRRDSLPIPVLLGFPSGWAGKETACNLGDLGWILGLGRCPGEGKGYPLQHSGLENSKDCIVHVVAKSQTQLSNFHFTSVQFSRSVVSDSLWPHEPQHARPPCPSPTPRVYPNSRPLSRWCHPTISSSVIPSSSCPQSFPASGSFQTSQLFASDGQSIGVSASISVLPMNTQDWSSLGWTGWISL